KAPADHHLLRTCGCSYQLMEFTWSAETPLCSGANTPGFCCYPLRKPVFFATNEAGRGKMPQATPSSIGVTELEHCRLGAAARLEGYSAFVVGLQRERPKKVLLARA